MRLKEYKERAMPGVVSMDAGSLTAEGDDSRGSSNVPGPPIGGGGAQPITVWHRLPAELMLDDPPVAIEFRRSP